MGAYIVFSFVCGCIHQYIVFNLYVAAYIVAFVFQFYMWLQAKVALHSSILFGGYRLQQGTCTYSFDRGVYTINVLYMYTKF